MKMATFTLLFEESCRSSFILSMTGYENRILLLLLLLKIFIEQNDQGSSFRLKHVLSLLSLSHLSLSSSVIRYPKETLIK